MIQSTDHNLNNPMEVNWIDLFPNIDMWTSRLVKVLTVHEFNQMIMLDPNVMYVVYSPNGVKMYLGDRLYDPERNAPGNYFIGMNEDREYVLYQRVVVHEQEHLVPICRVKEPESAINLLQKSVVVDPANHLRQLIYMQLIAYINSETDTNEVILGILATMGYREHPGIQRVLEVIQLVDQHDLGLYQLPPYILEQLHKISDVGEEVVGLYLQIHDVLLKYKFFDRMRGSANNYAPGDLDLSDTVSDILKVFGK